MYQKLAKTNRFLMLDGLRGIACMAVTLFHLYSWGPLGETIPQLLPVPLKFVFSNGYLGVQVFFVISGFVIAFTLKETNLNLDYIKIFLLRRLLRLTPPYWITIFLVISTNYISNYILTDRVTSIPKIEVILLNMLYMQNIFHIEGLLLVAWTLCVEVQFYCFFCLLSWILRKTLDTKNKLLSTLMMMILFSIFVTSLLIKTKLVILPINTLFIPDWYSFFLGVSLYWAVSGTFIDRAKYIFYSCIIFIVALLIIKFDSTVAVSAITAGLIYIAINLNHLHNWLSYQPLQYLGSISYSLYLLHTVIAPKVINIGYRLWGNSTLAAILIFNIAIILSLIFSHIFYIYVEKPSIKLTKNIQFQNV